MSFTTSFSVTWLLQSPVINAPSSVPTGTLNTKIEVMVYPQWYKYTTLEWTVPSDFGACTFHVYAAKGAQQEYTRLTGTALTQPFYKDPVPEELTSLGKLYYVVEAMPISGPYAGTVQRSVPKTYEYRPRNLISLHSNEIQRREYLFLTKLAGIRSFVFRRKTFGLRCTRCWNAAQEKVMDDHCEVCFGTSFEGGYFQPLPSYIQYEVTPVAKNLAYYGPMDQGQIGAWTISVPNINPWDIVIRTGDWLAYTVTRNTPTELRTTTVRQMMVLTQMAKSDVANRLLTRMSIDNGEYLKELGGDFNDIRFPIGPITGTTSDDFPWMAEEQPAVLPQKYSI